MDLSDTKPQPLLTVAQSLKLGLAFDRILFQWLNKN